MSNSPLIPEEGTICSVEACDKDAIRTWFVPFTDLKGSRLKPMPIDYCIDHELEPPRWIIEESQQ